jgi:multidrug efflux pump subunit AcrB
MARVFINSPLSPLLMIATLTLGVMGLLFTPRQEDPQILVPLIDIFIRYPGASSEQVASLAIEPLERIMSEIQGVKHVYSVSQRGQGMVTVRFEVGEDLGPSIVKVHDKLQTNLDKIPPGVSPPLVKPKGIDDVPIVTLTLWSLELDDRHLRLLAFDVLQRLKEVHNTGPGFVVGGRAEQIHVEVLPERLAGFGISLDQIASTIRNANRERGTGTIEFDDTHFRVYTGSFLRTAQDVELLVVGTQRGVPIYVRDVAQVFAGPEETRQLVEFYTGAAHRGETPTADGAAAVTVAIAKKEGTNGVTVANAVLHRVEQLKGQLIPDSVYVSVTRDYGKTANDKVNELLVAMLGAAVAVSVLCWITLGLRPAIVVITVIPLTILITIFSAWVLGYSINRVSLFALIFSIGILVDDATVVVENIYRRWLHDGNTSDAIAVDAVREVGNPTIMANLTIFAALLPMGAVTGMMGPYMLPIPILGTAAAFFSVVFAFIFTPWFSRALRPKMQALQRAEQREHRTQRRIGHLYRPVMWLFIRNRFLAWLLLISVIVAFFLACSMFYTKAVAVKILPLDNKPEFNVTINMPEGTALPVTANLVIQLAEELRHIPEVTALQTYVGCGSPFNFNGMVRQYYLRGEPWQADIQVMLMDKHDRERSSHQIAVAAREALFPIVERAAGRMVVVEMPPGPPVLQSVVAEIHGRDSVARRQVAEDMTRMFEQTPDLVDADNYMVEPHDYWRFVVNTEKALRRGIDVETITRNIEMAMGGYQIGDVKRGTVLEPTHIVIQLPLAARSDLARIGDLPILMPNGETIPLHELGSFTQVPEDPIIYHKDLRPVEYVVGDMVGRLGAPVYGMFAVEDRLREYQTPDGVKMSGTLAGAPRDDSQSGFEWAGEWTVTYETFRDMGLAFAGALVLIYILLVWEFSNFIHPAIVMAPIPLTLLGIIPGHWLMNAEFTATSMIGFIALAGVIVRNTILLVDFTKNEVAHGEDIRDAVVAAGHIRMRPIVVTDLTLIAGAAAIIFDPIFEGMAVSLVFGPIVATPLTLLVVPLGLISTQRTFYKELEKAEEGTALAEEDEVQVILEPGVASAFPDSPSVNRALRPLAEAIQQQPVEEASKQNIPTYRIDADA